MRFLEVYRYLMIVLAMGTFLASFRYVNVDRLRPLTGILVALVFVVLGLAINAVGHLLGTRPWMGLANVLLLDETTIWHGTTFISVAYGLLAFNLFRLLVPTHKKRTNDDDLTDATSDELK